MERESESLRPEELIRYVPAHVSMRIARGQPAVAFSEVVPAAALFADISGFTSLSERLATRGGDGVEELTRILNAYFGRLISVVTAHGGDVVKFAGDALLAFWPVENDGAALDRVAHIASRCALEIQNAVTQFDAPAGERLSLRVGVGAGTAVAASLGGVYGRYEFVLSGPAVVEATKSAAHAEPGFCIVGADAWKRVAQVAEATPAGEGTMQLARVRDLDLPPPPSPPTLDASAVPSLLAYIPASIHRRLAAHQSGWLAELRRLTVLFVKLPGLGYGTPFETGLEVMRAVQTELYRYEGSVNKLSVDEKGVTMLAALGLPPLAHEDDARRGTLAAMDMKSRLEELGQKTSVGVNSGNVFCGTIGDATRCEYTLIGDVVNVSARLMQAAAGGLLCGETTRKAAGDRVKWQALEPIAVKGKAQPLPVFRPVRPAWTQVVRMLEVTGRVAERVRIEARLDALQSGDGGVLLIEGDAGIGKSTLIDWMKNAAADRAVVVLAGAADPAQHSTSYFPWRPVFRRRFDLQDSDPPETQRAKVLAQLDDSSRPLAPLLESVLALGFTDNETTESMFGEVRSDNTVALLVKLLRESAAGKPQLIAIEDAHWFDSASWTLAVRVAADVPSTLLVLSTRPFDAVPRAWTQLQELPNTEEVILGPLDPEETLDLVCRTLGVESLPPVVAEFLRDRSQGNPFFVQEMAAALVESGRMTIHEGRCELSAGFTLSALPFPDTVQGVVTSRIDRLPAPEQLTLKVASVVGRTFTAPLIEDVFPIQEERSAQAVRLEALANNRLVQREDVAYAFSNAVTQDIAYELMAPTQRRELHGSVARWYETHFASELAAYYPILAKHWTAADHVAQAVDYLEKSGEAALRDHANEEALQFFEQALCMASAETADDDRRASWLRQCAEAHYNLGRLQKSREVFGKALTLLGAPLPAGTPAMLLATIREMGLQLLHRYLPSRYVGRSTGAARVRALEATRAYERLAQVYYLNNEKVETIHAAFRSLNLAEEAGPSAELARSYGNMTVVTGLLMMHATARAHAARALATAEAVNHPPTTAYVRFVRGVYYVTAASWDEGEADLRAAIDIAQRGGDRRRWYESVITLANLLSRRGKVSESRAVAKDLLEVANRRAVPQVQVWGAAWGLWCQQLLDPAAHALDEEATLVETALNPAADVSLADRILGAGMLALGRFRRGDRDGALAAADAAEAVIRTTDQVSHYLLESYIALAEVYDGLGMRARMAGTAKLAQRYAMMYPIGKPATLLIRGWIASHDGKTDRAASLYRRTLDAAARCRMPFIETAAQRGLARS